MIQPTRVLPSNAPPLGTNSDHPSRVLQEHSGNRQLKDYSYANPPEPKLLPSLLTENTYPTQQHVPQPAHVYRQTPLQRHNYRYGHSRLNGGQIDPTKKEKIARYLYHRFRASEHYMKYRDRQQKDSKNGEQKWPDRLELAFFQALVHWPPMGRRKLPHKDKLRGRNELISDCIEELTGQARCRKQVSSHIQVLKPFVEHDPFIMRWLSMDDHSNAEHNRLYDGHDPSQRNGRRASSYFGTNSSQTALPIVPLMSHDEFSKVKHALDLLEPTEFSMFVQRKHTDIDVERLHTYTQSITNPLQHDQQIPEWQSLQRDFPILYSLHQRRPLNCNVLLAETSLAFPDKNFKDQDGIALPGVELGISFLCSSRHLPTTAQIRCQNTFYKGGHLLDSSPTDVRLAQSESGAGVETQLKFGSTFWARTLASIATKLNNEPDSTKAREEVDQHIRGITALQELVVMTESRPERVLVIYWRFRLSTAARGRAYWMRVLLPSTAKYAEPKNERVDSLFDYGLGLTEATSSHRMQTSQPTLHSPFEYDGSSVSALTSATWPPSLEDTNTAPQSAIGWNGDNIFDFSGGNINMSYDPDLDFSTLDSSAFNFDAAADFAADPVLQNYSQPSQDFSQNQDYTQALDYSAPWCDSYSAAFDSQQSVTGAESYPMLPTDAQPHGFDAYGSYGQSFAVGSEAQAYGGAGEDILKGENALAALADASYMARATQNNV